MRSPCMLVHNLSWVGPRRATPLSLHACFSRFICLQNRRFGRYMGYTENTILALRAARGVVGLLPVPIPALSGALDAALEIAKLLNSVKDTRKACKELAERATAYTLDVYEELNSCGTAVDGTAAQAGVTKLLSVLEKIQAMMARKERKGFLKFTLHLAKNKSEVEDLSRELTDVQNIFLVRTGIRTDGRLVAMGDQQREIVQHMQDRERVDDTLLSAAHKHGTMLVEVREQLGKIDLANDRFRLCMTEVKLLEDVDEDWEMREDVEQETTTAGSSSRGGTEGIVRYRAEMYADKSPLIVKRFPRQGRTFTDEVELVKQLWHPNIVQLRGYSHDPEIAFIAYNMEQHVGSFEALGHEMSGVERLLWVLHATKQVHSALQHLASQSALFQWTEDHSDCAPLTGGSDLVVRPNASVVLDVSRWEVNQHQLPNLVVLYDWVILLNSAERRLIQGVKKDPLANVPVHKKRRVLTTLWRQVATIADFARGDSVPWPVAPPTGASWRSNPVGTRVVCPGECFLRSIGEIQDGLEYEKQVRERTLSVERFRAVMIPVAIPVQEPESGGQDDDGNRGEGSSNGRTRRQQPRRRRRDERRPRNVEDAEVVQEVPARDLISSQPLQACAVKVHWRRYTVYGMAPDWTLRTSTKVAGGSDCMEWLLMHAPSLCDLPIDLDDLAIATALRFTTCTYVIDTYDGYGGRGPSRPPPPTLYFYERVHDNPRATLGMDGRTDWPWAFWSTEDDDRCEFYRAADAHRAGRKHSIVYVGVTEGVFRWTQIIGDYVMHIDVKVEVDYSQFTRDECFMLDEIQEASIAEDELQSDPWRMQVDEEDEEDNESWIEPIWEEEDISMDERRHQNGGYDMEDEEGWYRESEIAQDLYWLNKERVYPVYEVMPYRRCREEPMSLAAGRIVGCWGNARPAGARYTGIVAAH